MQGQRQRQRQMQGQRQRQMQGQMQGQRQIRKVGLGMSFLSVMEVVGKGFAKGLKWAVTYGVPVERLVGLLFPAAAPVASAAADATTLIQTAVLLVEQKYSAAGVQSGTGPQKLSEVLLLTEQAVMALLAKAGIQADSAYIEKLVGAVVAILNVQAGPVGV